MLMIKTTIASSNLHGMGLFAAEDIPKGKIIWEYFPMIDITYTLDEWAQLKSSLTKASFSMIERYAYKEKNLYVLCTDNAQFMNHSETKFNSSNSDDLKSLFAIKDIKKGEELLCNYFEYSDEDDHHIANL